MIKEDLAMRTVITAAGRPKGESNDCTVRAMATALGVAYDVASAIMRNVGRRRGKGGDIRKALKSKPFKRLGSAELVLEACSVKVTTALELLAPADRYVICVAHHVFAVVDGKIHDTSVAQRDKNVKFCWKITPATGSSIQ